MDARCRTDFRTKVARTPAPYTPAVTSVSVTTAPACGAPSPTARTATSASRPVSSACRQSRRAAVTGCANANPWSVQRSGGSRAAGQSKG
ncbi:hypothetical protein SCYAM73S_05756 [Streptomyces cyaneofuscatus]